jgi:hypothetical protein
LLGALGLLLMTEAVLPFQSGDLLPAGTAAHLGAGAVIGTGVGPVSSVLGVAGGELLIPALVLISPSEMRMLAKPAVLMSAPKFGSVSHVTCLQFNAILRAMFPDRHVEPTGDLLRPLVES